MLCAKFGWNWPSHSWEDDFKISSMYFYFFTIIFPRKSVWSFILRKLNPPHSRMLCGTFSWNWAIGSRKEEYYQSSSMYFRYLLIISPWKWTRTVFCTKLNPLHPRLISAKFCRNWVFLLRSTVSMWKKYCTYI